MIIREITALANMDGFGLPSPISGVLFGGEDQAHKFIIRREDGTAFAGTVTAKFLRYADDVTVPLTGSIEDGAATVTLIENCYMRPGRFKLTMYVTESGSTTAIYCCMGTVDRTDGQQTIDPSGEINLDVTDLINRINTATASVPADYTALLATIAPTFSASTAYTAGQYVWYNGTLYRFTADHAAGTWTGTDAAAAVVGQDVSELKSAIGEIRQTTKNLFDKTAFDNASGITLGIDGYYQGTVNAFRDAFSSLFPIDGAYKSETRYTVSCKYYFSDVTGTYTGASLTFRAACTDGTTGNLFNLGASISTPVTASASTASSKTVDHLELIRADSRAANYVLHIKDVQVEEGTSVTEYVGHYTADDVTKVPFEIGEEKAGKLLVVNDDGVVEAGAPLVSRYAGKKISIIGDSIDTYDKEGYKIDGYAMFYPALGVTNVNDTWWMRVIIASGAALEVNASYSGSRVTNTYSGRPDFYDRVLLIGAPDIIFVTLGTNDSAQNVPLGDYDFDTSYASLSEATFRTAYIKGVKALQAEYPNAEIVCIAQQMKAEYKSSIIYIAKTLGVTFVDSSNYIGASDVHPGVYGMRQISSLVLYPTDQSLQFSGIPADGGKTGEAIAGLRSELGDELSDGLDNIKDMLESGVIIDTITLAESDFKQGGWGDTGTANTNTDRIGAYLGYIPTGTIINYALSTGHRLGVKVFQKEPGSTSNTKLSGTTSWQTGTGTYTTVDAGYVTIEVQVASGTITVNDYAETIYFNKGTVPAWVAYLQDDVASAVNTVGNVETIVNNKLLPERIINPTYELIKLPVVSAWSTTFQNFFEFGNEIWFCTASTAFGGDNHNGIVFRVNKADYSYIGKFNHNLGHMAQVDYDADADRIMLCNTESSSEPKIYIFHEVSEWPDIIAANANGQLVLDDLTYDIIDLAALRASHMQLLYAITCWAERQPDGNRLVVGEGTHGAQWFKLMLGMGTNNLGEGTYTAAEDGRFNGSYKTLWYKTCEFTEIAGRDTPQANQGLICYKGKFYEGLGHQPSYGGIYTPMVSDYVHRDIYNLQMFLPNGDVYGGQSNTGGVSEGTNIINGKLCVGIAGYSDETYLVMMDI